MLKRYEHNPLITASMVRPSGEGYQVLGVFNPGATIYNDQVVLIVRIAENCCQEDGWVKVPYFDFKDGKGTAQILTIAKNDPSLLFKDTRGVVYQGVDYLTTVSNLRLARSLDGIHFQVDEQPFIVPSTPYESFGIEDARVTKIDGIYYINYTGVSKDGFLTVLSTTQDFISFEHKGVIFAPLNKDVSIFEERINGKYAALHRPQNIGFGKPSIWYAESHDMLHWGNHRCLLRPEDTGTLFDVKIGGGAAPIKTAEGWLAIYHGVIHNQNGFNRYALNLVLLDLEDPAKVVRHARQPILFPTEAYETDGFVGNVVFTNGHIVKPNGEVWIYYGACDESVCLATATIADLLAHLWEHS